MTTDLSIEPPPPAFDEGTVPDPKPFEIAVTLVDGTVLITLSGEFDVSSAERLRKVMQTSCLQPQSVLLDMGLVSFIDSYGFAPVAEVATHRRAHGLAPIVLNAASPATSRLLRLIGFGAVSLPDPQQQ